MGYEINRKQQRQNHNSSNEGNNKEEEEDNHNSDIEHTERRRAAIDSACWFVHRSGNMTQARTEGVFQLAGGNLTCASYIVEAGAMNEEIQRVTERRFDLAQSAPVTMSSLCQLVGYCASTQFARDFLQGKVTIPLDVDGTTAKLIGKCSACGHASIPPMAR
jgi:hypothetical protein